MMSDVIHDDPEEEAPHASRARASSGNHANNHKAYILSTLSSICMVFMQLNLKYLTKNFSSPLVLSLRGSLLFMFNLLYLIKTSQAFHVADKSTFKALLKRGIASSLTVLMYLGAIKYIPMGIANALFNTIPIMTFFIEAVYYKKSKIRLVNLVIIIVSFIGVILIIQPAFLFGGSTPDNYIFYFIVLLSAFIGSFSMLFLHDLRGKCDQLIVLQHGYFFQATTSYTLYMFVNKDDSSQLEYVRNLTFLEGSKSIFCLILLVVFAFLTQYLQAKAMYLCSPALILPFSYFTVIMGLLIDVFVFDAKYNGLMVIGMIMASTGLFSKFLLLYLQPDKPNTQQKLGPVQTILK